MSDVDRLCSRAFTMNLQDIINAAADEADEFLTGVGSMTEARTAIREYLAAHHPDLAPADSARVFAGIVSILGEEGFFERSGGGEIVDSDGDPAGG